MNNLPKHTRTVLKIKTDLEFNFNSFSELNDNVVLVKDIVDLNSKLYDVTYIELYPKSGASVYICVTKLSGCYYYEYTTFSFKAAMCWYDGVTPVFKRYQIS